MKKTVLLLAALLIGQASADRYPENLKGLKAQDLCTIRSVSIEIDGKRNEDLESLVDIALEMENLREGVIFKNTYEKGCIATGFFFVDASKSGDNAYVFNVSYAISPKSMSVTGFGNGTKIVALPKPVLVEFATIWDVASYGVATDEKDLSKTLQQYASQAVQEFLADWRKAH